MVLDDEILAPSANADVDPPCAHFVFVLARCPLIIGFEIPVNLSVVVSILTHPGKISYPNSTSANRSRFSGNLNHMLIRPNAASEQRTYLGDWGNKASHSGRTTLPPVCHIEANVSEATRSASASALLEVSCFLPVVDTVTTLVTSSPSDGPGSLSEGPCSSVGGVGDFLAGFFRGLSDLRRLALTAALQYCY
jgi:hypothetical protein